MTRDFELYVEACTVDDDDGTNMVLAWPGVSPQRPEFPVEIVCKLEGLLDRSIWLIEADWAEAARRARRAKRLGLKPRKDAA